MIFFIFEEPFCVKVSMAEGVCPEVPENSMVQRNGVRERPRCFEFRGLDYDTGAISWKHFCLSNCTFDLDCIETESLDQI